MTGFRAAFLGIALPFATALAVAAALPGGVPLAQAASAPWGGSGHVHDAFARDLSWGLDARSAPAPVFVGSTGRPSDEELERWVAGLPDFGSVPFRPVPPQSRGAVGRQGAGGVGGLFAAPTSSEEIGLAGPAHLLGWFAGAAPATDGYDYVVRYSAPVTIPLPPALVLALGALAGLNALRPRRGHARDTQTLRVRRGRRARF